MIKWRDGYRARIDAATAHAEIERLGVVTPSALLDAARDEDSPIHRCFEWDDSVAAESHRRRQAYGMISSLVVEVAKVEVRKYHLSIDVQDGEGTRAYRRVEDILADPIAREILLRRARRDMNAFVRRYEQLDELGSVFAAIKETG